MGQVVTDIQIVGGQIRVFFGPCCWRDIGSLSDLAGGGADDPPTDVWEGTDGGETPVYSACGKAYGIVDVVYGIVEAAFSAQGELPWSRIGYVQDQVGFDLDNNWLVTLLANVQIGTLAGDSWENVEDTIERQKILSKLAEWFADDGVGVPSSEAFEEVKQIFKNEIWPDSRWQYFDQAINALGRTDMNAAAVMGATEGIYDCTPVQEFAPGADVYWRGDFVQTGQPVDKAVMTVAALSSDQSEITLTLTQEPGEEGELVGARGFAPLVVPYNIKRLVVEYTGELPYQDWTAVPYPPVDVAQQQELGTWGFLSGGGSTSINIQQNIEGLLRVEYVYANPGIVSGLGSSDNIRMPGGSQAGRPTEITFTARIVSFATV